MSAENHTKTLFFDLDGTLVDNFTALHRAYEHALQQVGEPAPTYEAVMKAVGGSSPLTMQRLIGKEKAPAALPYFREYFEAHLLDDLRLLPGAWWIVKKLHDSGYMLAIFSNKKGHYARIICDHLKLTPYFKQIIGAEDTAWRKPQGNFSSYALEQLGTDAKHAVLIGDSLYDLQAAQAVGMPAYLVLTGTTEAGELLAENPQPEGLYKNLYELGERCFGLSAESVDPAQHWEEPEEDPAELRN